MATLYQRMNAKQPKTDAAKIKKLIRENLFKEERNAKNVNAIFAELTDDEKNDLINSVTYNGSIHRAMKVVFQK